MAGLLGALGGLGEGITHAGEIFRQEGAQQRKQQSQMARERLRHQLGMQRQEQQAELQRETEEFRHGLEEGRYEAREDPDIGWHVADTHSGDLRLLNVPEREGAFSAEELIEGYNEFANRIADETDRWFEVETGDMIGMGEGEELGKLAAKDHIRRVLSDRNLYENLVAKEGHPGYVRGDKLASQAFSIAEQFNHKLLHPDTAKQYVMENPDEFNLETARGWNPFTESVDADEDEINEAAARATQEEVKALNKRLFTDVFGLEEEAAEQRAQEELTQLGEDLDEGFEAQPQAPSPQEQRAEAAREGVLTTAGDVVTEYGQDVRAVARGEKPGTPYSAGIGGLLLAPEAWDATTEHLREGRQYMQDTVRGLLPGGTQEVPEDGANLVNTAQAVAQRVLESPGEVPDLQPEEVSALADAVTEYGQATGMSQQNERAVLRALHRLSNRLEKRRNTD